MSMLTHTYPHKPLRRIEVAICNHQVDSPFHMYPDVCFGDLQCKGWMDERCFRPLLCTVKAELGRGQPGLMR